MIEISHNQARRLIRDGLDRRLPDERWAALQAHLELCPDCRAYQNQLLSAEKGVRHALRRRWAPVRGPEQNIRQAQRLNLEKRARRKQQIRRSLKWLGALAVFSLFVFYLNTNGSKAPAQSPQGGSISNPSATPTARRPLFNGVVAFSSYHAGGYDIRLINAGSGQKGVVETNLTISSTNETEPAWSPDGEWLAFLSDRVPGAGEDPSGPRKLEVNVMNVAGSRLARLTSSPDIEWRGPLTWSADGKYIALTGQRAGADPSQTWLYLVPLDGSGPIHVVYSRGVDGPALFSPGGDFLAYTSPLYSKSLVVYHPATGLSILPGAIETSSQPVMSVGPFDWLMDGKSLVYLQNFADHTEVRRTGELENHSFFGWVFTGPREQLIESTLGPNRYRSVSAVPGRQMVAVLHDSDDDDCWTLRLLHLDSVVQAPANLNGLCIDGRMGPGSFLPDGDWLVVRGHEPGRPAGGTRASLYALRIPVELASAGPLYFEKLTDVDLPTNPGSEPVWPEPVVRPSGEPLAIALRQDHPAPGEQFLPDVPQLGSGRLYYTLRVGDSLELISSQPDGSRRSTLSSENSRLFCPTLSPDGSRLAYVASSNNVGDPQSSDLYWMAPDGTNVNRLTGRGFAEPQISGASGLGLTVQYECPVWSPDGRSLAAVARVYSGDEPVRAFLLLADVEGQAAIPSPGGASSAFRFIAIETPSYMTPPRWTPDGKQVLLVYPANKTGGRPRLRLVAVDPSLVNDTGDGVEVILSISAWTDISGLAFSADGKQVALILFVDNAGVTRTQMRVLRADDWMVLSAPRLEGYENPAVMSTPLTWLPDGRVALVLHGGLAGPLRSLVRVYDPNNLRMDEVFTTQDVIYDAAWSPDGHWMAYTAESGLWVLDFAKASESHPITPLLLDDGITYDLDWK